ncbi:MAG: aldehyde dehydrogenase family protein, partial [Blastocatellia bacterium]|nr:aldehyde dehydrogenase family protein [Blastocatellia bacterium]
MKYSDVQNYIQGQFVPVNLEFLDVYNPANGSVISKVPLSGMEQVDAAVKAAKEALPAWSSLPVKERVQVLYRYRMLLEKNIEELTH